MQNALHDCEKDVQQMVKYYQKARDYLVPELNKVGIFSYDMPKGAFKAFPKIIDECVNSAKLVYVGESPRPHRSWISVWKTQRMRREIPLCTENATTA